MSVKGLVSLLNEGTTLRVSSTLDKSTGKRNLLDNNPETCWTSQQGLPQHIQINFTHPVHPSHLSLTFQGGFVGTRCIVQGLPSRSEQKHWAAITEIYPEDVNRQQKFEFPQTSISEQSDGITAMKLVFEESSDFFGRITIYDLKLYGTLIDSNTNQ